MMTRPARRSRSPGSGVCGWCCWAGFCGVTASHASSVFCWCLMLLVAVVTGFGCFGRRVVGYHPPLGCLFFAGVGGCGLVLVVECCCDESAEERVCAVGSGKEFGVGLGGNVVGVLVGGQFDEFDEVSVG
ncbi:Uncharacterised protein [Dermatophilus congolensis]|uniref:Transmembrane protein n=1 Tax=Dermatophilus congolensis TaxID=1863 RepID=A0AA46GZX0_9MICO|nr:Uncharacterised protein [Dermatophilus congolensis]